MTGCTVCHCPSTEKKSLFESLGRTHTLCLMTRWFYFIHLWLSCSWYYMFVLYCTYCILYYISIVLCILFGILLYYMYCDAQHHSVLHCITPQCITQYRNLYCMILHHTLLYCPVLYCLVSCTAWYCEVVVVMVVAFSSLARILGEGLTIHSPPTLFFFFWSGDQLVPINPTFQARIYPQWLRSWDNFGRVACELIFLSDKFQHYAWMA